MKVIGAGLPRTATTSQAIAYEKLGFGPCYHMRDVLMDMDKGLSQWEAVASGNPDWETIFGDGQSTCDWPGARYYKELLEYYPDSKVVLSVRSAEGWVQSMRDTVWAIYFGDSVMHHLCEARAVLDPLWKRFMDLMIVMTWRDRRRRSTTPAWPRRWIAGTTVSRPTCPRTGCWYGSRARAGDRCVNSSRCRCPTSRCRTSTTRRRSRRGSWAVRSGSSTPGGTSASGPAAVFTPPRSTSTL